MKTLYRALWLAALPLAFAACQNEEIEAGQTTGTPGNHTLHCIMGNHAPQSRAQVEIGYADPAEEIFMWNSGDTFTAYDVTEATQEPALYSIVGYNDEEPSNAADFVGAKLPDGHNITAIYPAQSAVANNGVIQLAIPTNGNAMESNTEEEIRTYMSNHMFMYATTQMGETNTGITFKHLCAMARVSYTNATPEEQTISVLQLKGDQEYFGEKINFSLQENTWTVPYTSVHTSLTFNNLAVASGKTVDFYLLFFPGQNFTAEGKLNIIMNIGDTDRILEMPVTAFKAAKFEAGKRYWFNVMQTEKSGLIWKKDVNEGVISNILLINAIEQRYSNADFVKDENGFVKVAENQEAINNITSLSFNEIELPNAEGIEFFTNLERLNLNRVGLRKLDVSKNTKLKELSCYGNLLTKLDVSKNTELEQLDCSSNRLTELNVEKNTKLRHLYSRENKLSLLNVNKNTALTILSVAKNKLSQLEVTANKELTFLDCSYNHLSALDVTQNKLLKTLDCNSPMVNGLLTKIDVSNNTELQNLQLMGHPLTSLDLSNNSKLSYLDVSWTSLSSLDVTQQKDLEWLICWNNIKLTSLILSNNTKLKKIECCHTSLTSLDISNLIELTELVCYSCHISTLDITNNLALGKIRVGDQYDENYNPTELTLSLTEEQNKKFNVMLNEWGNERLKLDIQ